MRDRLNIFARYANISRNTAQFNYYFLLQIDIPNVGHLFPFIGQASDMGRYYEKICKAMHDAAGGTRNALLKLAEGYD